MSLEITDTNTNSGKILYKGKEDAEPFYLYDNGFYGNRTVQYTIEEAGKKHQHVKLTVKVFRDNKLVYSIDKVIKCINLALITTGSDANMIKDYSTKGGINQCIAFSVDEMLIAGGKNAFSLEYKVNEYIGKYNRILAEYTDKVNNVYNYFNDLGLKDNIMGTYPAQEQEMENRLKAEIQTFVECMFKDSLCVKTQQ